MNNERTPIMTLLREALTVPVQTLHLADTAPVLDGRTACFTPSRILIPLDGEVEIEFASQNVQRVAVLRPGDVLVTVAGVGFDERWTRPQRSFEIIVFSAYLRLLGFVHPGNGGKPSGPTWCCHTHCGFDRRSAAIQESLLASPVMTPGTPLLLRALELELLALLEAEQTGNPTVEDREWEKVRGTLLYLFTQNLGREDFARCAHVAPERLSELVKKNTGRNLRGYLNLLRLDLARQMTAETALPIEEIGRRCGFPYASYFIRLFKREFGRTPADFRAG